jgi:hypothetical protein
MAAGRTIGACDRGRGTIAPGRDGGAEDEKVVTSTTAAAAAVSTPTGTIERERRDEVPERPEIVG